MKKISLLLSIIALLAVSCKGPQRLISDKNERETVMADFEARRADIAKPELFAIFDKELGEQQREALSFLYAYMPLADIADHSGEYFLANIESSFRAREEMPWGKDIPEREFRHFVLPIRVNNEDLDNSRMVFYEELHDRVKNLSLYDAVLEVNHWCHEKVTYRPSDSRTSSPSASVKTAYGRCGEESTFTVAALRSVGIPARQVYTPRWAHTDDNHAWVEAWVDGQWYFLGACEPAAVLNLAWFNAPASRGMLMHTKVFGRYSGPEEVMYRTPRYTEINVIDNYAPTAAIDVKVEDEAGNAVEGAKVEFKLYNYAEFYSVAKKTSDSQGHASLTAGKGDMVVWASKDGKFGYEKVSFGKDASVTVVLNKTAEGSLDLDITPPYEGANIPEVSPELQAENDIRLAREDSIRSAYEATFMNERTSKQMADRMDIDYNTAKDLFIGSRGNHREIISFLTTKLSKRKDAIDLLQQISKKDLRDVSRKVLDDHLGTPQCPDKLNFSKYVRNPRVSNEMLTPYKAFFRSMVEEGQRFEFQIDPSKLVAWVKDNVRIDSECNLGGSPISPIGVWHTRVADAHSRDIFFVSMARSMGIPSRIDPVTGKVQILNGSITNDVDFETEKPRQNKTGRLIVDYEPIKILSNPKYYTHFTISRLTEDGSLQLLEYDESDSWESLFRKGVELDEGKYLMVSGTRLAKGGVLAHMEFFTITDGKTTGIPLVMRESDDEIQVIGSFNSEDKYKKVPDFEETSILSTTGRGYFAVMVMGVGQEPSNHALMDLAAVKDEFEKWGRKMIVLFTSEDQYRNFKAGDFPELPSNISFGIDIDGSIQKEIAENMKLANSSTLPMVIIGDTFNRVVFISQGYTIGLGEQMLSVANKL